MNRKVVGKRQYWNYANISVAVRALHGESVESIADSRGLTKGRVRSLALNISRLAARRGGLEYYKSFKDATKDRDKLLKIFKVDSVYTD